MAAATYPELQADLAVLQLTDSDPLTLVLLRDKFLALSRLRHPDKQPREHAERFTEMFQQLIEAYHRVQQYIEINGAPSCDMTVEESHLKKWFQQHNNITVNTGNCTVELQNGMEKCWVDIFTRHYGPPVAANAGGLKWSIQSYSSGDSPPGSVHITMWIKPK